VLSLQGFYLVNGNFSVLGVPNAYSPAVASQPNVATNSLGLPASISVSRLGVLLNTGQAFQVRSRPCFVHRRHSTGVHCLICRWQLENCQSSAGLWAVPTQETFVCIYIYIYISTVHIVHIYIYIYIL
jgi:hypothetical protein